MTNVNRGATPKFDLGHILISPEAYERLEPEDIDIALDRHAAGDWGDASAAAREMNERGLAEGTRVRSYYRDRNRSAFSILTDIYEGWTSVEHSDDCF